MLDDAGLLRAYAKDGSNAAFTELVRRHVNLVFSGALRRVRGDPHRASDITQVVFTALARHAATLANRRVLASWLYTCTRNAAIDLARRERQHQRRHQEAQFIHHLTGANAESPRSCAHCGKLRQLLSLSGGQRPAPLAAGTTFGETVGRSPEDTFRFGGSGERLTPTETTAALGSILGNDGYRQYRAYGTAEPARTAAQQVAVASAAISSPLSPAQFAALESSLLGLHSNQAAAFDWDTVSAQASAYLNADQLEILGTFRSQVQIVRLEAQIAAMQNSGTKVKLAAHKGAPSATAPAARAKPSISSSRAHAVINASDAFDAPEDHLRSDPAMAARYLALQRSKYSSPRLSAPKGIVSPSRTESAWSNTWP